MFSNRRREFYESRSRVLWKEILGVMLLLGSFLLIFWPSIAQGLYYRIDNQEAHARLQELAQTSNVQIVRHTNDARYTGDPYNVTYELLVNGKPMSGHCTTANLSPLICRIYSPQTDRESRSRMIHV